MESWRVLIVDDEVDIREVVAEYLDALGHDVIPVGSGREAMDLIDRGGARFDIALVDWQMPGISGRDVILERVRATGLKAHARVTLTRRSTDIARIGRHLVNAGCQDVGVSPVSTGSDRVDLAGADLANVLAGMRVICDEFIEHAKKGRIYPFSNIRTVLEQIAAGDPRPVPCGAGTKLVAADNKGDLYACHRLVGQAQFKIGHVDTGVDEQVRYDLVQSFTPRTR